MQHLFNIWDSIKEQLEENRTFFFLDYDGTLMPTKRIVQNAKLSVNTRKLIEGLSKMEDCKVALVSSRSIKDLKQLTNFKNVGFIGNHGMEVESDLHNYYASLNNEVRYAMWRVHTHLNELLFNIAGLIIEDKKLSLSIHYRMVSPMYFGKIKSVVKHVIGECVKSNELSLHFGKNVIEIRPIGLWDKGLAAAEMLDKYPGYVPVCIGSDDSNEELFRTFNNKGPTIRVGKSHMSDAQYYVDNTGEVQYFLNCIHELKKNLKVLK